MESGSKKRTREMCWREKKAREMGETAILALIRGKTGSRPGFDAEAVEYRRRFPFAKDFRRDESPDPLDVEVPRHRQFWRKDLYQSYLKLLEREKKLPQNTNNDKEEEQVDHESDCEYPNNIADFLKLGEMERIDSKEFRRDMVRYARDKKKSDGFDVGKYPYRDAAGISSGGYLLRHYKPPEVNLPKARFITLVHLSELAISVYNMHQVQRTYYGDVQVLKAMKFGTYGTDLNITFQASFPPVTFQFQATVYDHSYPPDVPYSSFEIVLVRKLKGEEDGSDKDLSSQETDYVGVKWLPGFPSSMEMLSDFDEKDPQSETNFIDCFFLPMPLYLYSPPLCVPLHLCEFALHQYNIALHRYDRDQDEDDEIYDIVKVLGVINILRTLNDEHGTTYYITFLASLLDDNRNPQVFETKLFMSPLIPTTKIKIKFIRIKGN